MDHRTEQIRCQASRGGGDGGVGEEVEGRGGGLYYTELKTNRQTVVLGALDGGPPMLPVDFKKWQCRMSLSLIFPNVACQI